MNTDKLNKDRVISYLLTPLSWIYGAITDMRNKLYDWHLLASESFDVPVVNVGNITVGGTGKTPHVEFLVEYLSTIYHIGVLSRGYKRHTKGFVLGTPSSTPATIGDEPYQILKKYGKRIRVAVCEDRRKGIKELLEIDPDINLILLDDAYQHRAVKPKVNILLVDYNRPVNKDHVLPLGRLRENNRAIGRADIVVLTKVPDGETPLNMRIVVDELNLWAYQKYFFSHIVYGAPVPVFKNADKYEFKLEDLTRRDAVMLLTGIANPRPLIRHFKQYKCKLKVKHFPDHHDFKRADLQKIAADFKVMKGEHKVIITTEKDAVRLASNPYFPEKLKSHIYYIPISVEMLPGLNDDNFISTVKHAIESRTDSIDSHGPLIRTKEHNYKNTQSDN